jgi:hypothetical protein
MTAAIEAVIEAEPAQQRTEAGRGGLTHAKRLPCWTIDEQHISDTRSLQGYGKARARRPGTENEHINHTT